MGITSKKLGSLKGYYKVPFRAVYCFSIWQWCASVFRCHVWLRVFPPKFTSGPLPAKGGGE